MGLFDVISPDAELQRQANEKLATTDLTKYKRVETTIDNATNHDSQSILANLKVGDKLKIIQSRNRGRQKIEVYTAASRQVGNIPQHLVDELTVKSEAGPNGDIDYDNEKYFSFLTGFAVVRAVTGGGKTKFKCDIDLYYQIS